MFSTFNESLMIHRTRRLHLIWVWRGLLLLGTTSRCVLFNIFSSLSICTFICVPPVYLSVAILFVGFSFPLMLSASPSVWHLSVRSCAWKSIFLSHFTLFACFSFHFAVTLQFESVCLSVSLSVLIRYKRLLIMFRLPITYLKTQLF